MIIEDQLGKAGRRLVVAGVDGSPNSLAALHRAVHEAHKRAAGVLLVHTVASDAGYEAVARGYAMLDMAMRCEFPDGLNVPRGCVVDHGDPATTLVKHSASAELLVIGGRIHSEHGNLLGGDVVPYCLNHAECPIIVCADQHVSQHQPPLGQPVTAQRVLKVP